MRTPSGTPATFEELFQREYPRVVVTVRHLSGDVDLARDVAQEAFARLLIHWSKVSLYDRPEAWVRRVAIRELGSRRRRAAVASAAAQRIAALQQTEHAGRDQHVATEIDRAILDLPFMQRAAVVLFYFEDRPTEEIAAMLGCKPATARVHLHRAREALAAALIDLREESSDVR